MKNEKSMIQYQIGYHLKILFIGINPHPGSYRRGVPFSNNKMFWYLLHDAGLLQESREILRDDAHLKKLYLHDFKKKYHFGLLNMVDRPSRTITELKKGEELFGKQRLLAAIKRYKPKVVCFVGKKPYALFSGSPKVSYGWQPSLFSSQLFVMHAPHHGPARERIDDLEKIKKAL